ncbi:DUF1858 domain-containing protein [Thermocrinis minervae]|uniref:DUF1858 domain-containing protein n=1 Tax=Thermocrinis minervae TaxID=381751 RepID=A0A1M6QZ51_9AQUI|nr:DUF1858 domain-containing protein [Thermocrinis minervae]SHK25484.1 protein of unknown function [Thermocrinis minervae]
MRDRLTMDISLKELLEEVPRAKDILYEYGLNRLEEEDILDVVVDKLTLKGFFRLMDLDDETQGEIWKKLQDLYRGSEDCHG